MLSFKSNTPRKLQDAIRKALEYILSHQEENGCWTDWDLPVGKSDAWTTAYIGYKLRNIPYESKNVPAKFAELAANWILKTQYEDGGWGYNRLAGSDADSTAYCIIFLVSTGVTVPDKAYRLLEKLQSSDGGFSTYANNISNGSWGLSQPDVTPVALMALLTKYKSDHPCIIRGTEYVLKQRTSEGLWNSFWWNTYLYSTMANIAFLHAIDHKIDYAEIRDRVIKTNLISAFQEALLISILIYTPSKHKKTHLLYHLVDHLLNTQQPNGSWKSQPMLRITDRKCLYPWRDEESGQLYHDTKNLFTTSTILASLCQTVIGC